MTNRVFRLFHASKLRNAIFFNTVLFAATASAFAGKVIIISPTVSSSYSGAVSITASAIESVPIHLEYWDNGTKLGNIMASAGSAAYTLSAGSHTTTVLAVTPNGVVLDASSVTYKVTNAPSTGPVTIASPRPNSTSINAVTIAASVTQLGTGHLEIWDNGEKLGNVFSAGVDNVYVLPNGSHVLTVEAISAEGSLLSQSNVNFTVAESCAASSSVQCNLDQQKADNTQNDCNPAEEAMWVANACGTGVQGVGGSNPINTGVALINEPGALPNQGNLSLNGHSLHLSEIQGNGGFSNVLFRGQSPTTASTTSEDSHWVLDEYVYLPDPTAHQAFEVDAQASINGIWTKFYTECAFNINSGTGYWAVFDTSTGGWIFLNGQKQGGQIPPVVPCNRAQFAQPWSGSSNPTFTGWHHISWAFLRDPDGTVTFQSLTFDTKTTSINFKPISASGGKVNNNGKFSALIQLDGVANRDRTHDFVDVYLSQISITHTP